MLAGKRERARTSHGGRREQRSAERPPQTDRAASRAVVVVVWYLRAKSGGFEGRKEMRCSERAGTGLADWSGGLVMANWYGRGMRFEMDGYPSVAESPTASAPGPSTGADSLHPQQKPTASHPGRNRGVLAPGPCEDGVAAGCPQEPPLGRHGLVRCGPETVEQWGSRDGCGRGVAASGSECAGDNAPAHGTQRPPHKVGSQARASRAAQGRTGSHGGAAAQGVSCRGCTVCRPDAPSLRPMPPTPFPFFSALAAPAPLLRTGRRLLVCSRIDGGSNRRAAALCLASGLAG
ncbi:uncharacterized protein BJ171DRAFT_472345 [Polychytrium aggregatum]|uniref:uncharacterized protein n=1 Tax=Polychytrium aggregatum TaxID=110093 RepID=UPI0022FE0659|nr:uncharacterized protein BJ171DRAFT_472345 [Polychytrium aggregatum]KAI9207449.1 hypothetical protein BJ171DRAFT_472345 [Polychytrium aggregatum]